MEEVIEIWYEAENQRSIALDRDKFVGMCQYAIENGKWNIYHTEVDPNYGGRGIAKRLVNRIVDAARENNVKIIPTCSYAAKMMIDKEEYKDVL